MSGRLACSVFDKSLLTLALGTNNVPLGNRRRFSDESKDRKRSQSPPAAEETSGERPERVRRKRNRWGAASDENKVANLINLPTSLSGMMTQEQQEAYALNLRIEEISQKLRLNDVVPRDGERSPSPPPQYDNMGKRVNTREFRYRKKLEDERHKLVEDATKTIPNYKLPVDYRRPQRTQEKIYIPVNDYPEINFIGLLIGPRGNTLKKMETESKAKIAIRGKGSIKEGKGRTDVGHQASMDDDLHCLIIADDESKIQKAIELVNKVIETAASIPEEQNELKRGQLRELAALNGTLRDDEGHACQNCGEMGHRKYDCPNRRNFTASVVCRICGNQGHFARDCKDRPSAGYGNSFRPNNYQQIDNGPSTAADKEYEQLMLELGTGGSAGGRSSETRLIEGGRYNDSAPPPPRGGPAPWQQRNNNGAGGGGGPAPWKRREYDNGHNNDRYGNNNNDRFGNNNYRDRGNNNYNRQDRDHDRRDGGRGGGYGNSNYNNNGNDGNQDSRDNRGYSRGYYNNHDGGYNNNDNRGRNDFGQGNNSGGWSSHQPQQQHQQISQQQQPSSGGYPSMPQPPRFPGSEGGYRPGPPSAPPGRSGPPGASGGYPPPPPMPSGLNLPMGGAPPPPPGIGSGAQAPPPPPSSRGPPPPPPGSH